MTGNFAGWLVPAGTKTAAVVENSTALMKSASRFLDRLRGRFRPAGPGPHRVNLGCGGCFHRDWINLDFIASSPEVIQHDLRTRSPIDDRSCSVVYHSHVLEHFSRAVAPRFLGECHRLLQPGGILRVVVPDLEMIARLYLRYLDGATAGDEAAARKHEWMTLELLDQMVREETGGEMWNYWRQNPMPAEEFVIERTGREVLQFILPLRAKGLAALSDPPSGGQSKKPIEVGRFRESGEVHKWMYDRHSLKRLLEGCGFTDVRPCRAVEL